jgi:predicted DNA-binding mobile mystery protein A
MVDHSAARRHLDDQLRGFQPLKTRGRPHRGWIRAVRQALGMSTTELAHRMRISQSRIPELERGEVSGSLKLATLERAAEALDCDLVYALIPRTTLDDSVHSQARRKAAASLETIRHSMRLEDQSVDDHDTEELLDELATDLVDRRGLWTSEPA